jgi:hypothetical protein
MTQTKIFLVFTLLFSTTLYANITLTMDHQECHGPFKNKGEIYYLTTALKNATRKLNSLCKRVIYKGLLKNKEQIERLVISHGAVTCIDINLIDDCVYTDH